VTTSPAAIARLKQQEGGDLALFGSADLASTLMRHGLIDEYRLLVSPVVLGRGRRTFRDIAERLPLRLSQVQAWSAGLTALYYQPA
jgi:dihydrofolate reductase